MRIDLKDPGSAFRGWQFHVRGPAVFFVSPEGWQSGKPPSGKERQVFEVPRSMVLLAWEMTPDDKLEDVVKFSPPKEAKPTPKTTPAPAADSPPKQADAEIPAAPASESSPIVEVNGAPAEVLVEVADEDDVESDDDIPPQYKAHLASRGKT